MDTCIDQCSHCVIGEERNGFGFGGFIGEASGIQFLCSNNGFGEGRNGLGLDGSTVNAFNIFVHSGIP